MGGRRGAQADVPDGTEPLDARIEKLKAEIEKSTGVTMRQAETLRTLVEEQKLQGESHATSK